MVGSKGEGYIPFGFHLLGFGWLKLRDKLYISLISSRLWSKELMAFKARLAKL
jgi:hypothetical protein